MDRFEFQVVGQLIFGNNWKSEVARALGRDPRSNAVDKICKGHRGLQDKDIKTIKEVMRIKGEMLIKASEQLENPDFEKIKIMREMGSHIVFNENGVTTRDEAYDPDDSSISLYLYHAKITNLQNLTMLRDLAVRMAGLEAVALMDNAFFETCVLSYLDLEEFQHQGGELSNPLKVINDNLTQS